MNDASLFGQMGILEQLKWLEPDVMDHTKETSSYALDAEDLDTLD
jgi:hypothetical protein